MSAINKSRRSRRSSFTSSSERRGRAPGLERDLPDPPDQITVTEVTADPWLKDRLNRLPVPGDAVVIFEYAISVQAITGGPECAYLRRTGVADELWVSGLYSEGRLIVSPRHADQREAALELFDILVRVRANFVCPVVFMAPGLLTQEDFQKVINEVREEQEGYAEQAMANESEIVRVARELGLQPYPSGTGPHSWFARCPRTNHTLMISSSSDQFGCGYCKMKGGPRELQEFVARRLPASLKAQE